MITVNEIFSKVQNAIGDVALERVQLGEYIDAMNDIATALAEKTQMYISRLILTPNTGTATAQANISSSYAPYKLIQVMRRESGNDYWTLCREFSLQAIGNDTSGNNAFDINTWDIPNGFSVTLINISNVVDGSMTLTFTTEFALSEELAIDYISNNPFANTLTKWSPMTNPPIQVPDFMRDACYYGLLWKITESLYMRGDESFGNRAVLAKQHYDDFARKVSAYSRMFKDNKYNLQMMAINWLPE